MRRIAALIVLALVGLAVWWIGSSLSSDALSMAVGVIFGVLAGIPMALLALAGGRRAATEEGPRARTDAYAHQLPPYVGQPPVIVLAGGGMPVQAASDRGASDGSATWPQRLPPQRHFRIVGGQDEWIEE